MTAPSVLRESDPILISRAEAGFDRACESAFKRAVYLFGIDDDGYSSAMPEWDQSVCSIEVRFVGYLRDNDEHLYTFSARALRRDDD